MITTLVLCLDGSSYVVVCAGFRLNNAWANGKVLRPFLQPESPLSSQEFDLRLQVQAPGFELISPPAGSRTLLPLGYTQSYHYINETNMVKLLYGSFVLDHANDVTHVASVFLQKNINF